MDKKNENAYSCKICFKNFSYLTCLEKHFHRLHNPDRRREFECTPCSRRYFTARDLKQHYKVHNRNTLYKCHLCKSNFKSEKELKEHTNLPGSVCGNSSLIFNRRRELKPICSVENRQCIFCDKTISNASNFECHILTHIKECPFFCTICPYVCSRAGNFRQHLITHNLDRQRNFECRVCKKAFFTAVELKRHAKCHATERDHKCTICNKEFKTRDGLHKHSKVHDQPAYTCNICGWRCIRISNLNTHLRRHTGEDREKYACSICPIKFSTIRSLKRHLDSAHNPDRKRTFECHLCKKRFFTAPELRRHYSSLAHSGSNQVNCELCSKQFSSAGSLKKHLKMVHNSNR